MNAYYNEIDPFAAQWLRNLIAKNLIAPGDVDERDIREVQSDDLRGYTQCHFFAGIGGWSLALRLAGWDDSRPVWTGSCPCQPFSSAGRKEGHSDVRHLWPVWAGLLRECRPSVVFGEQVASAIGYGWADEVALEMETQGYAFASAVLPASGVGAPHRRNRFWFVADSDRSLSQADGLSGRIYEKHNKSRGISQAVPNPASKRPQGPRQYEQSQCAASPENREATFIESGCPSDFWIVEPGMGRVAHGISNRVGKLRGYGNAIVPQVAAEFIKAYRECIE